MLNLLLSNNCELLKVSDFGMSRTIEDIMSNNQGTSQYMAPEVFEGFTYSNKCDVYSFGIILWKLCSKIIPYRNVDHDPGTLLYMVIMKEICPEKSFCNTPKKLKDLVCKCWDKNPDN